MPVSVLFRNGAWCVLCCRMYPLKVTGHWNVTEKICMTRACNDMMCNSRNVVQTRCCCRTCLERNVCTTPRPTVVLSESSMRNGSFLMWWCLTCMKTISNSFYSIVHPYACTAQNCECDGVWWSCLYLRSLSWWLYVWAVCCRLCFPASM